MFIFIQSEQTTEYAQKQPAPFSTFEYVKDGDDSPIYAKGLYVESYCAYRYLYISFESL